MREIADRHFFLCWLANPNPPKSALQIILGCSGKSPASLLGRNPIPGRSDRPSRGKMLTTGLTWGMSNLVASSNNRVVRPFLPPRRVGTESSRPLPGLSAPGCPECRRRNPNQVALGTLARSRRLRTSCDPGGRSVAILGARGDDRGDPAHPAGVPRESRARDSSPYPLRSKP